MQAPHTAPQSTATKDTVDYRLYDAAKFSTAYVDDTSK
jgi:hypothetical protein